MPLPKDAIAKSDLCPSAAKPRRAPDCDNSEKRLEYSLHTDQDCLHFSVNSCTLIMLFICCDKMDTPPPFDDVERLRAHLFSPSHRINSQLLQWGHRICSNPCISPDMCLDWPALVVQLQVCLLDVCMFPFLRSLTLQTCWDSAVHPPLPVFVACDCEWLLVENEFGDCGWILITNSAVTPALERICSIGSSALAAELGSSGRVFAAPCSWVSIFQCILNVSELTFCIRRTC